MKRLETTLDFRERFGILGRYIMRWRRTSIRIRQHYKISKQAMTPRTKNLTPLCKVCILYLLVIPQHPTHQ